MPKYNITIDRVDKLDERWYHLVRGKEEKYVPSVTSIIEDGLGIPFGLIEWYKQHSFNSDYLLAVAGHIGTEVHKLIERTFKNEEVSIDDVIGAEGLKAHIWERYMRWCCFWHNFNEQHKIEFQISNIEMLIADWDLEFGGTLDFVCMVDDELTLFDWKTGKTLDEKAKIQLATYAETLKKIFNVAIKHCYLIHLPAIKPNKLGYRIIEVSETDLLYNHFIKMLELYKINHAKDVPKFLSFPTKINYSQIITNKIEV